jgi:hypothetical protein
MWTFLELCKSLCVQAQIAGGKNAIQTTVNQDGKLARIVEYIQDALIQIENRYQHAGMNLRYMRHTAQITTVSGTPAYAWNAVQVLDTATSAAIPRFQAWLAKDMSDAPKCYLQSAGVGSEGRVMYLPWNDFKNIYRLGNQNPGQPAHITIDPQNRIVLGPTPADTYIITLDYLIGPQLLGDVTEGIDEDTPLMPDQFRKVIVWKALSDYGMNENAPELVTKGEDKFATWMGDLEANQLEDMMMADPLC